MLTFNRIHFIGIGGISMSALAMLTSESGIWVSGSDRTDSDTLKRLRRYGIVAYVGSNNSVVAKSDLVVYSSAVNDDDVELKFARSNKIRCMERKAYLALISKECKSLIAISGSHGKTTATAMLCHVAENIPLAFKGHIGGLVNGEGSNFVNSGNDYFITEACEYQRSFLSLQPDIGVILNCDYDHPDTYPTIESMREAFSKFAEQCAIALIEENAAAELDLSRVDSDKIYTFGLGQNADFRAVNIRQEGGKFSFDVTFEGQYLTDVSLNIFGKHNIFNALAVIGVCYLLWLDMREVKCYVQSFGGVQRRFTQIGRAKSGAKIIVDYAHHPKEISATVDTVRLMTKGRIVAVFEPHTFSRTKALLEEFGKCFYWADELIVLPTYSARENSEDGLDGFDLVNYLNSTGAGALYIDGYRKACEYLQANTTERDVVLVLGAGSVDALGEMLRSQE